MIVNLFKSKRGSVTMTAFIAMMFLSIYGIIVYGNSVNKYNIQKKAIQNIQRTYNESVTTQNMQKVFENNNGETYNFQI